MIKYIQYSETPSHLLIEYLPLGSLSLYLDSGSTFSPERCCRLLGQIASALGYIHKRGIVHCDINPNNVLLRDFRPFHAILADFGLARETNCYLRRCGTEPYIAPEIYGKEIRRYGEAADIWSSVF